jgi:beta-glucosidase
MNRQRLAGAMAVAMGALLATQAHAAPPWMNPKLSADKRADLLQAQMSVDEEFTLLHGHMPRMMRTKPADVPLVAGHFVGVPRLGIPDIWESDASLGVANAGRKDNDDATALPSGLSLAATFDPKLAFAGGAMIGKETRQKGFNVLLAGGANIAREPRNGRNFEYLGEDPLLAGTLDGASIRGIQSAHVASTAKHFALNDQETGRMVASANMSPAAARESDLLAFEIAIEGGQPNSVMCSYNRIDQVYACENPAFLNGVLKGDWGWKGWVMSDWGAVHSAAAATAGLDQESGEELDRQIYFDQPLRAALASGKVPASRVHDMVHRILRGLFAAGVMDHPVKAGGLDTAADGKVAARAAEQGVVLLKNDAGLLPLAAKAKRILVIGGHADFGVISGGGSSQVIPLGSMRFKPPQGAPVWSAGVVYDPYSPLKAIMARAHGGAVTYIDGSDPAAAAAAAKDADVAIVFATQWASEAMDVSLTLQDNQDALVSAVAAANPHTVVVLETGDPVLMPWLGQVGAVVEAWYPGANGGETIAKVLYGEVNPAGRLPITFPASVDQLPHPVLPGSDQIKGGTQDATHPFDIDYTEGSDVGYRWYASTGKTPLFAFGHGLSYTAFAYDHLTVKGGSTITVSFRVRNTGGRAGIDTPQVYLGAEPNRTQQRLIGWSRVALRPGESRVVTVTADKRLLASWDDAAHDWKLDAGAYQVFVGPDAATKTLTGSAKVAGAQLKP